MTIFTVLKMSESLHWALTKATILVEELSYWASFTICGRGCASRTRVITFGTSINMRLKVMSIIVTTVTVTSSKHQNLAS